MTRGHKSQYGIGCVVEVVTGLVLNLAVISLYCQRCVYACTQYGGKDTEDVKTWFTTHEPECNQNYHELSGGQSSCGGVQRKEASVTPPCSPMATPGHSTTCQACECMEIWSSKRRSASTTSPNDLALHCTSWPR